MPGAMSESPNPIVTQRDRSVVGQDRAKRTLAAGGNVAGAQRDIVFIDEIDMPGGGRVYGTKDMRLGVQHGLLRMIEGTVTNVPPSGGDKLIGESCIPSIPAVRAHVPNSTNQVESGAGLSSGNDTHYWRT